MSSGNRKPTETLRDPDFAGAEAAMHRAARDARRRAEEVANIAVPGRSTEKPGELHGSGVSRDSRKLTFSQAQGYEEIPGPLKLEELPREARTRIWNVFYTDLVADYNRRLGTTLFPSYLREPDWIGGVWEEILLAKHLSYDNLPLDEWSVVFKLIRKKLRDDIERKPFHKVFDLIQFVLRHPKCPSDFITVMKQQFKILRLAYMIDEGEPPTIVPAVTEEEGNTIIESLKTLRGAGLDGSAAHLRRASNCINENDWAGSIRESIHAVESVARQIAPEKTDTLPQALNSIEKRKPLHSNLKQGFKAIYWYTSDEQGLRHALLDREKASVGMDEAVFMLGACASFASYLWRKHTEGEAS